MSQKILVVDDEPNIRSVIEVKLAGAGFDVVCASSAEIAWDLIESVDPALLILDHEMPGKMDGFTMVRRMRESENRRLREMPVILVSGTVSLISQLREREGVFSAYDLLLFTKPFSPRALLKSVQSALPAA